MTRVLFVDDEPNVLEGLRDMLRRDRRRWEMSFVEGGGGAIELLNGEPLDIVVCDMRMPVVDGSHVLEAARALQPSACRVVLSGQTDRESMLRSIRLTHRFLAKPCEPDELRRTIESLGSLDVLLPLAAARDAVGSIVALPVQADVRDEAAEMFASSECSPESVARIAAHDPALTANLLRLGSSAFFGTGTPLATVTAAAAAIGADGIRAPELANAIFDGETAHRPGYPVDLRAFAEHSSAVARRVEALRPGDEAAFAAGLLHDIGKLVLAESQPELLLAFEAEAAERGCELHVVERERRGATHAEIGGVLLGLWGLSPEIVTAVALHADPAAPAGSLAAAIRIAEDEIAAGGPA
ncbi:MAG: HDOD domain-containing protein [Actinomycetota bacterium]